MENNTATFVTSSKKARNIRLAKDVGILALKAVGVVAVIVGVSAVVQHYMHDSVVDEMIQGAADAAGVV